MPGSPRAQRVAAVVSLALGLGVASAGARADIYGYIDEQGSAHFSIEKLDSRYQLFMRGDKAFDSADLKAGGPLVVKPALLQYLTHHPNLKKYEALLADAALEFSVEPALLKAVMAAESGFNPGAVSPKGAVGLMQLMPATAARYGLQADGKQSVAQRLTDPKTNIRLGARYLRDLRRLFPNQQSLVLASYNAGEGAVQKYNNRIPPYAETQNYVKLVTQFVDMYRPGVTKTLGGTAHGIADSAGGMPNSGGGGHRIYLTIPGRAKLPPAPRPGREDSASGE
ncbi:MAG: Lytic transglycosylase, catalytic [Herminiimonas sp.]|nr:Lytic transglycosylase, catalytic [Herminiimonas sp.]